MAKSLEVHADNGKSRMVGCAPPFQDGSHHNQCHGLKRRGTMAANPPGKRGACEAVLAADGNPGVAWGTPAPQCQPPVRCVSGLPSRCLLLPPTEVRCTGVGAAVSELLARCGEGQWSSTQREQQPPGPAGSTPVLPTGVEKFTLKQFLIAQCSS